MKSGLFSDPRGGTSRAVRAFHFRVLLVLLLMAWLSWQVNGATRLTPGILQDAVKFLPFAQQFAMRMLNTTVRKEAEYTRLMRHSGFRDRAFRVVQNFLGGSEQAKRMSYASSVQLKTLELLKNRYDLDKRSFIELQRSLPSILLSNAEEVGPDEPKYVGLPSVCPYPRKTRCQAGASFRTFDGCCNNLKHSLWGASFQPLIRLLQPDYADGISAPRGGKYGTPLASPRLVTWKIHADVDNPSRIFSLMVMLLGQFIDHDLSRTAISKLSDDETGFGGIEDVMCGVDGCEVGKDQHQECMPIEIPHDDPLFSTKRCLMFVRTLSVPEASCKTGPRQQLNQITSYLDASHIYGSTRRQADALRDFSDYGRGALRMRHHPYGRGLKRLLPDWESFSKSKLCRGANSTVRCFLAGDGRVNEHVGLMCLHTSFAREHNRIEAALHQINPHWDGQRLYFETRRIMGAMWQHIVYNEYLPVVLGSEIMKYYGLTLKPFGYYEGYNPDMRVDVSNSFATAAFRYGHSLIQGAMKMMGPDYSLKDKIPLSNAFRSPAIIYQPFGGGPDYITRGFLSEPVQSVDPHLSVEIVGHLFSKNPPGGLGTDLAALNVQRGRDHGLPGYAAWREWCGLGRPKTFADLSEVMPQSVLDKFAALYDHVDDIDLFPAAISEYHVKGAMIGQTFACILADQFQRSRRGDRFWYENRRENPYPFTPSQLGAIRRTSLAKILCENGDNLEHIQPRVMLLPLSEVYGRLRAINDIPSMLRVYPEYQGSENNRLSCQDIPDLDLRQWRETPPPYTQKQYLSQRTSSQYRPRTRYN